MQFRTDLSRESAKHNTLALLFWSPGQSLPQVFRDVRHNGVDKTKSRFQSCVNGVLNRLLDLRRGLVGGEGLSSLLLGKRKRFSADCKTGRYGNCQVTYNENIAQLVKPEAVDGLGNIVEVPLLKGLVDFDGSLIQLVQDPSLCQCLVARFLWMSLQVSKRINGGWR